MKCVTVHKAKTTLSQLIAAVEAGEDVVIQRGADPVVRLVPIHHPAARRQFGALAGKVNLGPGFFDPLPEAELTAWDG
jgi:prevent-host-death family protein